MEHLIWDFDDLIRYTKELCGLIEEEPKYQLWEWISVSSQPLDEMILLVLAVLLVIKYLWRSLVY